MTRAAFDRSSCATSRRAGGRAPVDPRRPRRVAAKAGRTALDRRAAAGRPGRRHARRFPQRAGSPGGSRRSRPIRHLAFPIREHARRRTSARPLGVLAPRRRLQDRQARRPRGRVRAARARPHRPRRDERRGRALQGLQEARRQADPRASRPTTSTTARSARARSSATTSRCSRRTTRASRTSRSSPAPASSRACTAASRASTWSCSSATAPASSRSSGCLASRASRRIVDGRLEEARAPPRRPRATSSGPRTSTSRSSATASPSRSRSTRRSSASRSEMGRSLVATADVHYLRREDYHHHAALLCVQTKSTLAAPKMSFDTNEFYLKSSEEMAESFARLPEALAVDAGDRGALRRVDRARRPAHPELRDAERRVRARPPARAGRPTACACATATRSRPPRWSARRWSSASSTRWASTPTS